ncbi:hypothetical protein RAH12_26355, partial [Klebsiella pneumoniae]
SSFSLSVSEKIKDKECPVTHCKQCRGLPTAKTCFSYEKLKPKPKTKIGVLICEVLNGFI